ncbi:MAG: malto-oligosyltrehalose synthase [Desulfuromonadales bacterium]|nr:malto-oligosyltrehalose synthase [Desulfuromonadales bacterium]NIR33500.1 malto-oligosyltrehalose synthase [Desulfuromonadales bacterium]NIS39673.1 malto-oligosyltrehalose synthase [Desulfuromonadales bacterium]
MADSGNHGLRFHERTQRRFLHDREPYAEMAYAKKKLIIEKHMFGDLNNLAHLLKNIAARHRYGSDITMDGLKRALIEVLALFPVYRSYLGSGQGRDVDSRYVEQAVDKAGEKNQGLRNELDYIRRVLLFQFEESAAEQESAQWLHFVRRFQQLSGPLMAKGLEDTLLYVYNRLLSLNEVGGNPERFGVSLESFHAFNRERLNKWPHALSATATHDTKRGEDVRARLNVLSEIPQEWERRVRGWSRINRPKKRSVRGSKAPDGNDEYFLYQTLVGALPLAEGDYPGFVRRIKAYLVKAVREAKVHTAWLKPDTDYEEAFVGFAEAVLSREGENSFLEDFLPFARMIAHYGMINSLAQTLVKITAPGVPDFYQGTEFWDLSLVDPDNRRPVDYATRQEALREISATAAGEIPGLIARLLDTREDGRIKLFLMHRALAVRRKHQLLFSHGEYRPLRVSGAKGEHVIAFARQSGERAAVIVAPRFPATLTEPEALPLGEAVWEDTGVLRPEDAGADWEEAVTGRAVHCGKQFFVGEVLQDFPVALLTNFRAKSGIR